MSEPVHEVGEVPPRHGASVPIAYMAANIILTIANSPNNKGTIKTE